jgi:hypothetical protein
MQDYPSIDLGIIPITDWDKLREFAKKKGDPYLDMENTIVILSRRKDWRFTICKLYHKGIFKLGLYAIRNPWKRIDQLREIKKNEFDFAESKARELLREFAEGVSKGGG